jgi:hypothetical protein
MPPELLDQALVLHEARDFIKQPFHLGDADLRV